MDAAYVQLIIHRDVLDLTSTSMLVLFCKHSRRASLDSSTAFSLLYLIIHQYHAKKVLYSTSVL